MTITWAVGASLLLSLIFPLPAAEPPAMRAAPQPINASSPAGWKFVKAVGRIGQDNRGFVDLSYTLKSGSVLTAHLDIEKNPAGDGYFWLQPPPFPKRYVLFSRSGTQVDPTFVQFYEAFAKLVEWCEIDLAKPLDQIPKMAIKTSFDTITVTTLDQAKPPEILTYLIHFFWEKKYTYPSGEPRAIAEYSVAAASGVEPPQVIDTGFGRGAIFQEMVIYNSLPQVNDAVIKAMDDLEAVRQKAASQFK